MTNKQLIKTWKNYSIEFKTSKEIKKLTDLFLICWGETNMEEEKVVVFDQGGEQGSPGLFCQCDEDNNCIAFSLDSKNNKVIKSNIGKFIIK